jgi:hypothetical protein
MLSQLSYSPTRKRKLSPRPGAVKTRGRPADRIPGRRGDSSPTGRERDGRLARRAPEWRNGYTQGTQNPPAGNGRVGSNPTSGTTPSCEFRRPFRRPRDVRRAAPGLAALRGRFGLVALAAALWLTAGVAHADHRDFAGRVKAVSEKRVTVENRMGDRRSFVRGKKTQVKGERRSWQGLRPGDEVVVDWHLEDRPARARGVRVIEKNPSQGRR